MDLSWLGRTVEVTVDRPLGSVHPEHPELVDGLNYGFVAGTVAGDGEPVDAYVLGVDTPVDRVTATVVAVIERRDDVEDKLAVAVAGSGPWTEEAIAEAVRFQERWFDSFVHMSATWADGAGVHGGTAGGLRAQRPGAGGSGLRGRRGPDGNRPAAIAVLAGVPAVEVVAWVRRHYNRRAVETPWQRRWVRNLGK